MSQGNNERMEGQRYSHFLVLFRAFHQETNGFRGRVAVDRVAGAQPGGKTRANREFEDTFPRVSVAMARTCGE